MSDDIIVYKDDPVTPLPSPNETHIQAIVNAMKKAGIISGNIIGNNIATVINAITKRTSLSKTTSGNNLVVSGSAGYYPSAVSQTISGQAGGTYVPTTYSRTLASGGYYLSSNVTMTGDANLTSSNIRSGVTIFGVPGTYQGQTMETINGTISRTSQFDVIIYQVVSGTRIITQSLNQFNTSVSISVPRGSNIVVVRDVNTAPPYYSGVALGFSTNSSTPRTWCFDAMDNGFTIQCS